MKIILNYFIKSSLWVAIAVTCIFYIESDSNGVKVSWNLLWIIGLGTMITYNAIKYYTSYTTQIDFPFYKPIFLQTVAGFGVTLLLSGSLSLPIILFLAGVALLSVLYIVPFSKIAVIRNIRSVKIFYVAFVLSLITYVLPLEVMSSKGCYWGLFRNFWIWFLLILPFDIETISTDSVTLGTLPQRLGILTTKILGLLMVIMLIIIELLLGKLDEVYIVMYVLIALSIWQVRPLGSSYFTTFGVESIPVIGWLVYMLLKLH